MQGKSEQSEVWQQPNISNEAPRIRGIHLPDVVEQLEGELFKLALNQHTAREIAEQLVQQLADGALTQMGLTERTLEFVKQLDEAYLIPNDPEKQKGNAILRRSSLMKRAWVATIQKSHGAPLYIYTLQAQQTVLLMIPAMVDTVIAEMKNSGISVKITDWKTLLTLYRQFVGHENLNLMVLSSLNAGLDRAVHHLVEILLAPIMPAKNTRCRATLELFALMRDEDDGISLETAIVALLNDGTEYVMDEYLSGTLNIPKYLAKTPGRMRRIGRFRTGGSGDSLSISEFHLAVHGSETWHDADTPAKTVVNRMGDQLEKYLNLESDAVACKKAGIELEQGGIDPELRPALDGEQGDDDAGYTTRAMDHYQAPFEWEPICSKEKFQKIMRELRASKEDIRYAIARYFEEISSTRDVMAAHLGTTDKEIRRLEKRWDRKFHPPLKQREDVWRPKSAPVSPEQSLSHDASVYVCEGYVSKDQPPRTVMYHLKHVQEDSPERTYRIAAPRPVSKRRSRPQGGRSGKIKISLKNGENVGKF